MAKSMPIAVLRNLPIIGSDHTTILFDITYKNHKVGIGRLNSNQMTPLCHFFYNSWGFLIILYLRLSIVHEKPNFLNKLLPTGGKISSLV